MYVYCSANVVDYFLAASNGFCNKLNNSVYICFITYLTVYNYVLAPYPLVFLYSFSLCCYT
jgi:hypothetical protein